MRFIGRVASLSVIAMVPLAGVTLGAPLVPVPSIPQAAPRAAPRLTPPAPRAAPQTNPQETEAAPTNGECKNPDAIGTSRVIAVDPAEHGRIGHMNYLESLPLNDHEVVLTFDDGPLPPRTTKVLSILASQCVKATFFLVGKMANEFPSVVKREYAEGHAIGSHSQTHPHNMQHMTTEASLADINAGIDSVTAALGDTGKMAPFFRFPGFAHTPPLEANLASRGIMVWGADFPADDWTHISAKQVLARALSRLELHGRGVLLLHDIQPATVQALPLLLAELKKRHYNIVQVVPASADHPKTETDPQQWLWRGNEPVVTHHTPAAATPRATPVAVRRPATTTPKPPRSN